MWFVSLAFGFRTPQPTSDTDGSDKEGKAAPSWMKALKKTREANKAVAEAKEKEKEAAKSDPKLARVMLRKTTSKDTKDSKDSEPESDALDFRSLLRPRNGEPEDPPAPPAPAAPAPKASSADRGGEGLFKTPNLRRSSQIIEEEDEEASSKAPSKRASLKRASIISKDGNIPDIPEPDYADRSEQLKEELDKEAGTMSRKGSSRSLKRQSVGEDSTPEEDTHMAEAESGTLPKHASVAALQKATMDLRPQSPMEEIQQQVSLFFIG